MTEVRKGDTVTVQGTVLHVDEKTFLLGFAAASMSPHTGSCRFGLDQVHEHEPAPRTPDEPPPGAYLIGATSVLGVPRPLHTMWLFWYEDQLHTKTWEQCWATLGGPDVKVTPLVPRDLPEVELPWAERVGHHCTFKIADDWFVDDVKGRAAGGVYVEATYGDTGENCIAPVLTPGQARAMAAALIKAAALAAAGPDTEREA